MERTISINLKGKMSACLERREALLYEFLTEREGIIDEECHDLLEVLEEFDGENVEISIIVK